VIACAKHFLGYAQTEAGQIMAAVAVGPRELHDVYAWPFGAAIRLAGLGGVMASYSEYEGVPIHISRAVLTDLLRGRLGFTGTVVSDHNGIGWDQRSGPRVPLRRTHQCMHESLAARADLHGPARAK
jgi:beta-glucosidase